MNSINPNNYPGATVTLVGYVSVDPRWPAYDRNGERGYRQIPVAINEGYKKDGSFVQTGTTWYDVEIKDDDLDVFSDNGQAIVKGAKIRVDNAKQETRTYKDRNDVEKIGITLKFGNITVLETPGGGSADEYSDDTPF